MIHYGKPKIKIVCTHTGSDYELQNYFVNGSVTMQENAADNASFVLADEGADFFENKIAYNDPIRIYVNYEEEGALGASNLVFYGFVEDLTPYLSVSGEVLNVVCRSYARCLLDLLCGEQYGTQSTNIDLDTIAEILTHGTKGLIPLWVNKLLGDSGVESGYSLDYSLVEAIAGSMTYLYFPFKPAKNCLDDLQDLLSAIKGSGAPGAHWIVKPIETVGPAGSTFTHYFMLGTVGNHSGGVLAKWSNWWNPIGDTEELKEQNSTIEVKKDMVIQQFTRQRPESNYVLYHGSFVRPPMERWTENNNDVLNWTTTNENDIRSRDTSVYKVGLASVKMNTTRNNGAGVDHLHYKGGVSTGLDIDVTKIGGRYNIPTINFFVRKNVEVTAVDVFLGFGATSLNFFGASAVWMPLSVTDDVWCGFHIPIGPYARNYSEDSYWREYNTPDWTDLDNFSLRYDLAANNNTKTLWVDGLTINGWVLRGAKKLKADSSPEDYYKTKLIVDDVAKDDSLSASDDTGTMGRLACAELLRASRRPITGTISIPGKPSILPGQKAHVHAVKTSAGAFRVDKNMRVTEHRLNFTMMGLISYLTLTDDLYNGLAMSPQTAYNTVLRAVSPEFQSRQLGSIKAGGVDISQTVLEKPYAFSDVY